MTVEEVTVLIHDAFHDVPRPDLFIRGTCSCEECMEHNETMQIHTREDITIHELGNPGWDPISFASDEAFVYYLPAMFRLAFGAEDYIDQLVFHLDSPGRLDALDRKQVRAVLEGLWVLVEERGHEIQDTSAEWQLESAIERLEERLGQS